MRTIRLAEKYADNDYVYWHLVLDTPTGPYNCEPRALKSSVVRSNPEGRSTAAGDIRHARHFLRLVRNRLEQDPSFCLPQP